MLGVPKTVAQTLQQGGRVGRDQVANGRAVVFVQSTAYKSAEKYLAQDPARRAVAKYNNKNLTTMNNEKALMLTTADCLVVFLNSAPSLASFVSADQPPATAAQGATKKTRKLTKAMRTKAEAELRLFRERVHKSERDRVSHGYTPASSYFPNPAITSILDNFLAISTLEIIATIIPK
ncbi:hypothetical protein B0H13DRAFT_1881981 [Mycena leptocephala]|nr:hypothetical protein B0H13DRAFT_1881981 [Mycena leptocephala]